VRRSLDQCEFERDRALSAPLRLVSDGEVVWCALFPERSRFTKHGRAGARLLARPNRASTCKVRAVPRARRRRIVARLDALHLALVRQRLRSLIKPATDRFHGENRGRKVTFLRRRPNCALFPHSQVQWLQEGAEHANFRLNYPLSSSAAEKSSLICRLDAPMRRRVRPCRPAGFSSQVRAIPT
jgi:hypothetical protein